MMNLASAGSVSYTHLDVYKRQVPVPSGSITILDATLKDDTETVSVEGINAAMKAASSESFGYTEEELVSSDIIGMEYGSLFDATQTLAERCGTKIYEVRVVAVSYTHLDVYKRQHKGSRPRVRLWTQESHFWVTPFVLLKEMAP